MEALTTATEPATISVLDNAGRAIRPQLRATHPQFVGCFGRQRFRLPTIFGPLFGWDIVGNATFDGQQQVRLLKDYIFAKIYNRDISIPKNKRWQDRYSSEYNLRYMLLGRNQKRASPYIIVLCSINWLSRNLRHAVLESNILFPGWGCFRLPFQPHVACAFPLFTPISNNQTQDHDVPLNDFDTFDVCVPGLEVPRYLIGTLVETWNDGTFIGKATIGGFLLLDGKDIYALSVAHAFCRRPAPRSDDSDFEVDLSELNYDETKGIYGQQFYTPSEDTTEDEIEDDTDEEDANENTFWAEHTPQTYRSSSSSFEESAVLHNTFNEDVMDIDPPTDDAGRTRIGHLSIISDDGLDWALIAIDRDGVVKSTFPASTSTRTASLAPEGNAIIVLPQGELESTIVSTSVFGPAYNAPPQPVLVAEILGPSISTGSSGSWLFTAEGTPLGMLIGVCEPLNECYFLSMSDILADIERQTGLCANLVMATMEEATKVDQLPARTSTSANDGDSHIHSVKGHPDSHYLDKLVRFGQLFPINMSRWAANAEPLLKELLESPETELKIESAPRIYTENDDVSILEGQLVAANQLWRCLRDSSTHIHLYLESRGIVDDEVRAWILRNNLQQLRRKLLSYSLLVTCFSSLQRFRSPDSDKLLPPSSSSSFETRYRMSLLLDVCPQIHNLADGVSTLVTAAKKTDILLPMIPQSLHILEPFRNLTFVELDLSRPWVFDFLLWTTLSGNGAFVVGGRAWELALSIIWPTTRVNLQRSRSRMSSYDTDADGVDWWLAEDAYCGRTLHTMPSDGIRMLYRRPPVAKLHKNNDIVVALEFSLHPCVTSGLWKQTNATYRQSFDDWVQNGCSRNQGIRLLLDYQSSLREYIKVPSSVSFRGVICLVTQSLFEKSELDRSQELEQGTLTIMKTGYVQRARRAGNETHHKPAWVVKDDGDSPSQRVFAEIENGIEYRFRVISIRVWHCLWCNNGPMSTHLDQFCIFCFRRRHPTYSREEFGTQKEYL